MSGDRYEPVRILHVDEDETGVPPARLSSPGASGGYTVAFRLSRPLTKTESNGVVTDFGSRSLAGSGRITARVEGSVLLLDNTTIDYVLTNLQEALGQVVDGINKRGAREHQEELEERHRVEAHRRHVHEVAQDFHFE